MRLPSLLAVVLLASACAHAKPTQGSLDDAERVAAKYLKLIRWQDLRGSETVIAPERRAGYRAQVDEGHLEQNLKVAEYELKDLQRVRDGAEARVDLSWYVEPSVTLRHEPVVLHLSWRGSAWAIDAIEGGPISLPPLAPIASPDAGP